MNRRAFLAAGAGFAAAGAMAGCTDGSGRTVVIPRGTRLIILRHANREGDHLTALGRQRAKALVGALKDEKIDAIYYPGIRRNYDTAAPLAEARDLPMHRITEEHPATRLMQVGAGRSIVWVGNKGNLHSIWKDLGAPGEAPLDYGDLFIVTRGTAGVPVVSRRYFGPQEAVTDKI